MFQDSSSPAVTITDIVDDFMTFTRHGRREPEAALRLWREHYESRHTEIFAEYFSRWGHREDLPRRIDRLLGAADVVSRRRDAARRQAHDLAARSWTLLAYAQPYRVTLMVGTYGSDAWTTAPVGEPTCSVALETLKIGQPLSVALAHEMAHATQFRLTGFREDAACLGERIVAEGFACAVARHLVPGADLSTVLPCGHSWEAWRSLCVRHWPQIRRACLEEWWAAEPSTIRAILGGIAAPRRLPGPERCGYLVGTLLVDQLLHSRSLRSLTRTSLREVAADSHALLDRMTEPVLV